MGGMNRVLVFAAHPDDETLGAGGTIVRHVQRGDQVMLVVATKAYAPDWDESVIKAKSGELASAAKILGIHEVNRLELPAARLDTVPLKDLIDRLSQIVRSVMPNTVYCTSSGDLNQDHRRLHDAVLVASRPLPESSVKLLASYEVLSSTGWAGHSPGSGFHPSMYLNIAETLERKKEAMRAYTSELREAPHPRSLEGIDALARKRGHEAGLPAAEAFEIVRFIE